MISQEQIDARIHARKMEIEKLLAELGENRRVLNDMCFDVLLKGNDPVLKNRAAEILRQQLPTNEAK